MAKRPVMNKEPIIWGRRYWLCRETCMRGFESLPMWWAFCIKIFKLLCIKKDITDEEDITVRAILHLAT